ncbi:unnamed protein product [Closterium sp. Naga37s-1]|nr:unnamed protein product [Closterium sp. Naga37s-1]
MLQKLVTDGSVKGLEVKGAAKEIGSCPTCLETKFTKFPFSSSTGPAKAPLALVHMDVVGPTRAPSLSGSRYFLTILDEHTRAVWVYPLKTKRGVAAAVLKEWMPRAQRESGHKVKVTVSEEEISGVTEDGGEAEVEEQQQQQDAPPRDQPVPEPETLAEALSGPDAEKWKQSMKEEYDSLLENETWEPCELPPRKKVISSKLIFRHKYGPDGVLTRYKSRLLAKGFQQTKGKDFDELYAPVGRGTILRVMLGTAASHRWKIKQMDITTTFLNGIILEELYMLQPEGLDDGSGRVCRLKKAIYGLKQAPRAWYHKLEETLLVGGFKKSDCDHGLFLLQEKEPFLMLLVYVDDILLFSESSAMIERVEEMLEMQFKCSKMGDVKYYLGMHVERDLDKGVLRLHQRKYCEGLAKKYGLQDGGKPATPLPSGFTVEPCADEKVVAESDKKLFHSMNEVGLSSCEKEYMALHHGAKEVVWLMRLLEEISVGQREPNVMYCDNESAVKLAKNACLHGLTKHIRPKWYWVRRLLDKEVRLEIVKTH